MSMETKEALTRFLLKCEERGLSPETKRTYHGYLRHFAEEYPELPTDTKIIEAFLRKRKETPKKRGPMFKYLQAFYSYLENFEGVKSPVPPKGKVGRPSKKLVPNLASTEASRLQARSKAKLVQGGSLSSSPTSILTEEAVRSFITQRRHSGLRERTFENYGYVFSPFMRRHPILPLKPEPIEEFIYSIQGEPETRHRYYRTLKSLYRFLEDRRGITNPFKHIQLATPPRKERDHLTREQVKELMGGVGSWGW